jgi:tryptophan synthase alpha chain
LKRLADALVSARESGRLAFLPCVTAGDPDAETSLEVALTLAREGADLLGLEVPFSDPLGECDLLRRAGRRAIAGGMNLGRVLELVQEVRRESSIPVVLFTWFNPVHRRGLPVFAEQAARAGVDGVLVSDLPPEEGTEYRRALSATGLDPVFMLSPTSGPERARLVADVTGGLICYAPAAGARGDEDDLPGGLRQEVARIRLAGNLPVAVDVGIVSRKQVEGLGGAADAVVLRTAMARCAEKASGREETVEAVRVCLRELMGKARC